MMFGWVLIIGILIYWVVKNEGYVPTNKPPLARLQERLAKGDITIEEYQRIKQQLEE